MKNIVILTVSVSDGSLSHLGSQSGKFFLQDHEDIKSQFLSFCLKRQYRLSKEMQANHQQAPQPQSTSSYMTSEAGYQDSTRVGQRKSAVRGDSHGIYVRPSGLRHEPYRNNLRSVRGRNNNVSSDHETSSPGQNASVTVLLVGDETLPHNAGNLPNDRPLELSDQEPTTTAGAYNETTYIKMEPTFDEQEVADKIDMIMGAIADSPDVKLELLIDDKGNVEVPATTNRNVNIRDDNINHAKESATSVSAQQTSVSECELLLPEGSNSATEQNNQTSFKHTSNRKTSRLKTNRDGKDVENENRPSEKNSQDALGPEICVQTSLSNTGKWIIKKQCCIYCKALCTNLARHLASQHADKPDVAKALSHPKMSKERRRIFDELTSKGNFEHNTRILENGKGTLIPKYRPRKKDLEIQKYLPCEFCRAHIVSKELWRHHKTCPSRPSGVRSDGPVRNSKLIMSLPLSAMEEFNKSIISKLREGPIAVRVRTDPLILKFGERKFLQTGKHPHTHQHIAQRLRELGRLCIALNKRNDSITTLSECLTCKHWNTFIEAVKDVAGYDAVTQTFSIPSLALKIGSSVKKCAKLLRNEALKTEDANLEVSVNKFLDIFEEDWCELISRQALESRALMKFATITYLTLAEDVSKLSKYLSDEINKISYENDSTDVGEKYGQLASLCLAQVVMFNGKHAGAAQLLQLDAYKHASNQQTEMDEEVKKNLTIFEQELCENHFRIETIDSKGRKVILLLTNKMQENLDTLTKLHDELGLATKYIFQKPNTAFPFNGRNVLQEYADEAGLKHASRIASSSLRKQLATTSQVLGLTDKSNQILSDCIGHDLFMNSEFNQMPKTGLEIAKITKVVHALNSGTLTDVAGKNLDDIDAMEPVEIEIVNEDDDDDGDDQFELAISVESDGDDLQLSRNTAVPSVPSSPGSSFLDSDSDSDNSQLPEEPKPGIKKRRFKRKPWTNAEKRVVETGLKWYFEKNKLPGKLQCEKLINKHDVLKRRSWTMIKGYVRNTLKTRSIQKNRSNRLSKLPVLNNKAVDFNCKMD